MLCGENRAGVKCIHTLAATHLIAGAYVWMHMLTAAGTDSQQAARDCFTVGSFNAAGSSLNPGAPEGNLHT